MALHRHRNKKDVLKAWQPLVHIKWKCKYHMVLSPKIVNRCRTEIAKMNWWNMTTVCRHKGIELPKRHTWPDHIRMCLNIQRNFSISMAMGYFKGISMIRVHHEFMGYFHGAPALLNLTEMGSYHWIGMILDFSDEMCNNINKIKRFNQALIVEIFNGSNLTRKTFLENRKEDYKCLYHTVMLWILPQIWELFFNNPA